MGGGAEGFVHAWWHVQMPMEAEFLGFGHERLWSTSMLLVSSNESLDWHKFERGGTNCLGCDLRHNGKTATVIHGSCVMPWDSNLKTSRGFVDLCYACMNLLYCVNMFV